jgi:hypothetical protein
VAAVQNEFIYSAETSANVGLADSASIVAFAHMARLRLPQAQRLRVLRRSMLAAGRSIAGTAPHAAGYCF